MAQKKTFFQIFFDEFKSLFLSGLLTLLPIILTFAFFSFALRLIQSWFHPIYHIMPSCLKSVVYSEIYLVLIAIFFVGAILKFFLLHPIVDSIEKYFVKKLPLIRPVYFGIKQLIHAFSPQDTVHFQKVVALEFPRPGIYSIGFVTNRLTADIVGKDKNDPTVYCSIFIPNTPNPTTGYYVIIPEKDCTVISITRQEAMTIVISGGIIQPDRFIRE